MTKNAAKEYVKKHLGEYVNSITTRKGKQYVCPLCHSGTGVNKTAAGSITPDGQHFHCFSCNFHGDTIDLIGEYEGILETKDKFKRAFEIFNITVGDEYTPQTHKAIETKQSQSLSKTPKRSSNDYTEYIIDCKSHVNEVDYFIKRGLSQSTIERYNLGYDPLKKMVVIPYNKANSYYITRSIGGKSYFKLKVDEAGAEPIYNLQALYNKDNKPVFITEGQIDALSVIEVGEVAISIGGVSGIAKIVQQLQRKPTDNILILSLDNDEAGTRATTKLEQELQIIDVKYVKTNISGVHKDPNEALIADKDIFLKAVEKALGQAVEADNEKKDQAEIEQENYKAETSVTAHISDFLEATKQLQ